MSKHLPGWGLWHAATSVLHRRYVAAVSNTAQSLCSCKDHQPECGKQGGWRDSRNPNQGKLHGMPGKPEAVRSDSAG